MKKRCSQMMMGFNQWRSVPCSRAGVVERHGEWFCKQHDPEAVKARRDASQAKFDEQNVRANADYRLRDAAPDMLAALKEVRDCLNDPRPTNYSKIHRANQIIEAAILKAEPQ